MQRSNSPFRTCTVQLSKKSLMPDAHPGPHFHLNRGPLGPQSRPGPGQPEIPLSSFRQSISEKGHRNGDKGMASALEPRFTALTSPWDNRPAPSLSPPPLATLPCIVLGLAMLGTFCSKMVEESLRTGAGAGGRGRSQESGVRSQESGDRGQSRESGVGLSYRTAQDGQTTGAP